MLMTTFGMGEQAKEIKVGYLVKNSPSSYNMIMRHTYFNQLGATLSTLYLCKKYLLSDEQAGVIQGD